MPGERDREVGVEPAALGAEDDELVGERARGERAGVEHHELAGGREDGVDRHQHEDGPAARAAARNDVTALTLAAEREGARERSTVPTELVSVTRATYAPGGAFAPRDRRAVPGERLRAGLELRRRRARRDERAVRRSICSVTARRPREREADLQPVRDAVGTFSADQREVVEERLLGGRLAVLVVGRLRRSSARCPRRRRPST